MIEMASVQAAESFHSVTLSVSGQSYTANLWRGGSTQWRLLSVSLGSASQVHVQAPPFESCRAALEAAETIAIKVLAQDLERLPAAS